jgi:hypothetical protein
MAEFPSSTVIPSYPYELLPVWKTIVSAFDSGKEQRRQKQTYAKYDVKLKFENLTNSQMQTLWNFYIARRGSYEAFHFYTPDTADWDGLYIGVGDATKVIFDIPGKNTSTLSVYIDGAATSAYTALIGGGESNSDRIEFNSAPTAGQIITCDFSGYLRIRCRFKEDSMSRELFEYTLHKTSLELKGVSTD